MYTKTPRSHGKNKARQLIAISNLPPRDDLGVANYIENDETAKSVNNFMREKCGVSLDAKKVKKGLHQEAAKCPTMPGKQSLSVICNYDNLLDLVLEGRVQVGQTENRVSQNFKKRAVAANDAFIELHNFIQSRPILASGHVPGTTGHTEARELPKNAR